MIARIIAPFGEEFTVTLRLVDDRDGLVPVFRRVALTVARPADHARMRVAVYVDGDVRNGRPARTRYSTHRIRPIRPLPSLNGWMLSNWW